MSARKRIDFDEATFRGLKALSSGKRATIRQLAEEAFQDVLHKQEGKPFRARRNAGRRRRAR